MNTVLREELAKLIHSQWSQWADFMLNNLTKENSDRWTKQIATSYENLSDAEKDKDRIWADKMIKITEKYAK